jgi:hypothetical protein
MPIIFVPDSNKHHLLGGLRKKWSQISNPITPLANMLMVVPLYPNFPRPKGTKKYKTKDFFDIININCCQSYK